MDEADLLSDRIFIMARGALQCTGSPLWLKERFGIGYSVVVSRSAQDASTVGSHHISDIIRRIVPDARQLPSAAGEVAFRLAHASSATLPSLFRELDARRDELGISACGVSASTLEEVFVILAHRSEQDDDGAADQQVQNSDEGCIHAISGVVSRAKRRIGQQSNRSRGDWRWETAEMHGAVELVSVAAVPAPHGDAVPVIAMALGDPPSKQEAITMGSHASSSLVKRPLSEPLDNAAISVQPVVAVEMTPAGAHDLGVKSEKVRHDDDGQIPQTSIAATSASTPPPFETNHTLDFGTPSDPPSFAEQCLLLGRDKRLVCARRDRSAAFWQLLLPPILVALSLLVLVIKFDPAGPALEASANIYGRRIDTPTELVVNYAANKLKSAQPFQDADVAWECVPANDSFTLSKWLLSTYNSHEVARFGALVADDAINSSITVDWDWFFNEVIPLISDAAVDDEASSPGDLQTGFRIEIPDEVNDAWTSFATNETVLNGAEVSVLIDPNSASDALGEALLPTSSEGQIEVHVLFSHAQLVNRTLAVYGLRVLEPPWLSVLAGPTRNVSVELTKQQRNMLQDYTPGASINISWANVSLALGGNATQSSLGSVVAPLLPAAFKGALDSPYTILHNASSFHALFIYTGELIERLYQQCRDDDPTVTYTVRNHPLPLTAQQSLECVLSTIHSF